MTVIYFSGSGARAFARLLDGCGAEIVYAEHISMPNNIPNIPSLPKDGACVVSCPAGNLEAVDGKVLEHGRCTLCFRCVNLCPRGAATVLIRRKPMRRYGGPV